MARYNMQRSEEMARAIHNLRIGNTKGQIDRALMDKIIVTGAQAGLGAVGHVMEGQSSEALQEKQRNEQRARAAAGALKSAPLPPSTIPKENYSVDEYGLPRQMGPGGPGYDKQMNSAVQGGNPDWLKSKAEEADNNQALNMAAAGANIGGYRTPAGAEASDADSDMRAANLQTGKNILDSTEHMGGMMSSLPMRAR